MTTWTVEFTRSARNRLRTALNETADGREVCGALYGGVSGRTVTVEDFHLLGSGHRTPEATSVDGNLFRSLENTYNATWIGDIHTHPGDDDPLPSDTDVRGWQASVRSNPGVYIGIVATSADGSDLGWLWPRLRGWAATSAGIVAATLDESPRGY
jgi:proteasome lid subunit RPN8/RPN11